MLLIEKEAVVGIKANRTNPEGSAVGVHLYTGSFHAGFEPVEIGLLDGPKRRRGDIAALFEHVPAPGRDGYRRGGDGSHHLPRGIENAGNHPAVAGAAGFVIDLSGDADDGGRRGPHLRARESAPMCHMYRAGLGEPDVSVDAGAFVKPAIAERSVDTHQQHIASAIIRMIADVVAERRVAAEILAQVMAVEDDDGIAVDPVKFGRRAAARVGSRQIKDAAVPADGRGRILTAQRVAAVGDRKGTRLKP